MGKSSGRADDLDDTIIRNRFKSLLKETTQVAGHYKKVNKVVELSGIGSIEDIFEALKAEINK
ncbi:MAG: hypothetical protein IPF58_17435 [Saprospirales bacterium]|nr:hypothetical protein [Saprospirales bacterium]